jgi:hypothetical protein
MRFDRCLATVLNQTARRQRWSVVAVSAHGSGVSVVVVDVVVDCSVVVGFVVDPCANAAGAQISAITVASTSPPARNDFT